MNAPGKGPYDIIRCDIRLTPEELIGTLGAEDF